MTHLGYLLTVLVLPMALAISSSSHAEGEQRNNLHHSRDTAEVESSSTTTTTTSTTQQQTTVDDYHLWKPFEISKKLQRWKNMYPDLIRVTTAQEKYGLRAAGGESDCPFSDSIGCPNYIFTIQDFVAHPEDSDSSALLPELFWSGCLHGNERVGPTATMEAATLLLEAASCEGLPRSRDDDHVGESLGFYGSWEEQVTKAKSCRKALHEKGVDDAHRKWLARLVTTRRIVVVPTTNALGYYLNQRTEGMVDPNRDFPYDLTDPKICMQTIAARTANEIYREHMFQLALTFHGGMEVVGYEWGAPTWNDHFSPDDEAQSQIASAYSRYGGGWSNTKAYDYGTMNDLVYYVRGGMEDWAYAGSFDPDRVIECEPNTYGGYPKEKTIYNNSTLRVFNMLIETSNAKEPRKSDLGSSLDVLRGDTKGNGHVSRNIRLALLSAEHVEPYVSMVGVDNLALSDDVPPLSGRGKRSCQKAKAVMVAKNAKEVQFQWTVGGSMTIDNTELWFAKWDDIPEDKLDCMFQPTSIIDAGLFMKGTIIGASNGTGAFSQAGAHPRPSDTSSSSSSSSHQTTILGTTTNGPIFTGKITIPDGLKTLEQLVVIASARVDQSWTKKSDNTKPLMDPQSHVVNARTNPDWYHESAGKIIRGRLDWFSIPVTLVIGDFTDSVGKTQGDQLVTTVEMNHRFVDDTIQGGMKPKSATNEQMWFPVAMWQVLAVGLCLFAFCLCCMMMQRGGGHSDMRSKNSNNRDPDDFVFDSKPYSDRHADDADDDDEYDDGGVELPRLA